MSPCNRKKNAKQVVEGLPTLSFPVRGPHSRTCLPQRPSVICEIYALPTATCVALVCLIFNSISQWNSEHCSLGDMKLSYKAHSDHVSVPYVITGNTHWSWTFIWRYWGIWGEKIWCIFPNAAQPSWIRRLTSSSKLDLTNWTNYVLSILVIFVTSTLIPVVPCTEHGQGSTRRKARCWAYPAYLYRHIRLLLGFP